MTFKICHLFEQLQHCEATAQLIFDAFWTDVPDYSVAKMAARLGLANGFDKLPTSMIAVDGNEVVGAVNLVDDDGNGPPDGVTWLAGLVVVESRRGDGIGSALVRAATVHANSLGFDCVYLGTDGPDFYARLGGVVVQQRRTDFWIMRIASSSATLRLD